MFSVKLGVLGSELGFLPELCYFLFRCIIIVFVDVLLCLLSLWFGMFWCLLLVFGVLVCVLSSLTPLLIFKCLLVPPGPCQNLLHGSFSHLLPVFHARTRRCWKASGKFLLPTSHPPMSCFWGYRMYYWPLIPYFISNLPLSYIYSGCCYRNTCVFQAMFLFW
jgi:hypothetical protein